MFCYTFGQHSHWRQIFFFFQHRLWWETRPQVKQHVGDKTKCIELTRYSTNSSQANFWPSFLILNESRCTCTDLWSANQKLFPSVLVYSSFSWWQKLTFCPPFQQNQCFGGIWHERRVPLLLLQDWTVFSKLSCCCFFQQGSCRGLFRYH